MENREERLARACARVGLACGFGTLEGGKGHDFNVDDY